MPLLVVGAGPAGMAAAVAARRFGVETVVCDENAAPGGQVWRNVERVAADRSATLALLGADYVQMATLKGLSPWRVVFVHAFPNALSPILSIVMLTVAYLVVGTVVVLLRRL